VRAGGGLNVIISADTKKRKKRGELQLTGEEAVLTKSVNTPGKAKAGILKRDIYEESVE